MSTPTPFDVVLGDVPLRLDPRGAVARLDGDTVFVADLHLGKSSLFRRRGLAVPEGDDGRDLDRLGAVVDGHGATRLVVLGDLVHAADGLTADVVDRFATWRARRPELEIVLVRGNHDRGAGAPPPEWNLAAVEGPWSIEGVTCRHEPPEPTGDGLSGAPVLAGHLHPVVRVREGGRGAGLRPRCFWWRAPVLVVPAFGSFTGGHPVRPAPGDRVFAVPPDGAVGAGIVEVT